MALPGNGVFVVKGEITILLAAMRRTNRWAHSHADEEHDNFVRSLLELKDKLSRVDDLKEIDTNVYLTPFLKIIRSDETTGPVTSIALSSVNKFLSYGLIDPTHCSIMLIVENIADAVRNARFVSTDQSSDGVVLLKILQVLRTLVMAPEGASLSNDSICEILLSCFRICFEPRLNDLLRKTAEYCLRDMVQLLFMRLPQFGEEIHIPANIRHMKMYSNNDETSQKRKFKSFKKSKSLVEEPKNKSEETSQETSDQLETKNDGNSGSENLQADTNIEKSETYSQLHNTTVADANIQENNWASKEDENEDLIKEYVNPRGVRFMAQNDGIPLVPYGLVCVHQLFNFLISLCNPLDKQNNESMIGFGLVLLTVAFEIGADSIGKYPSLLLLVKDELARNLISLLSNEKIPIFASVVQLSFLVFESLRTHLKFQLEYYLKKLIDIVISDSVKVTYEHKEIALDNIVQLWKIPGLVTELFLNYDCDMYCTNLFEDLTKLIAKNAFPVTSGIYHTHLLSLDALLTIIEAIEAHCYERSAIASEQILNEDPKVDGEEIENISKFLSSKNNRQKVSHNVPTREQLLAAKNIKKWLPTGTEHFNLKPKKGIQFLQEHGVLSNDAKPEEIVHFLKENPNLDKKMIGEYISNRNNLSILEAFVKSFDFTDLRIDEALRLYLETFRLPGEAPLISLLMEHFAEHWHKCNGEPFANADAAFTLAYAIIMLNVDQHNHNVKKQNIPMTIDDFKKNLKNVNGGQDFDGDMLNEIYIAIKNEEIVMPAEHTGIVKENYLWKVLLRRGVSKDGVYVHVPNGIYDCDLFNLIWGPTLAALGFVFDKSEDKQIYQRAIKGFERCAFIGAHYGLYSNMDTLLRTLCKFTTLTTQQKQNNLAVQLGCNKKAQLALKTVFGLSYKHGDALREGWKHLLDLIFALYNAKMLPKSLMEAEDFIDPSGKISLFSETTPSQKIETGLFSSLYSYMVNSDNLTQKTPSAEEQGYISEAKKCIKDCNIEQLIADSKFLHLDSLNELIKKLMECSRGPDGHKSLGLSYDENTSVFYLELLLKVVIQNRDRVMCIWQQIRDHLYSIVMAASSFDYQFILERSVVGLLRLAIRLMRNEEMSPTVLQSLRMLLLLKSSTLYRISRQISFGLYELLKTSAQNIHSDTDWSIIFTLLECVGAGAKPPKIISEDDHNECAKSEGEGVVSSEEENISDRGYTSDSELIKSSKQSVAIKSSSGSQSPSIVSTTISGTNTGGWIIVGKEGDIQPMLVRSSPENQYSIVHDRQLLEHDPYGLVKCCESLAFLVRDVAHITPYNFENCVHCIRTFVEASLNGENRGNKSRESRAKKKKAKDQSEKRKVRRAQSRSDESDDSDSEDLPNGYQQVSIQLLDLMHTLHTRTAQIFKWWAEENGELPEYTSLWIQGWCPLLQGIARLCCDSRRQIRMSAITYLQRALLVHDLQTLSGPEWEACFNKVLFPLLAKLLEPINPKNSVESEETRMRAATLLAKVFLHHLTPLLSLQTFSNLWITILDFMDKYMHADKSDLLYEAIPESLKNMLLVMDSAKVFHDGDNHGMLWTLTWERIGSFLPNLKEELFKEQVQSPDTNPVGNVIEPESISETSSIQIQLSPLVTQEINSVSSPLFTHLGQMVSTPIGINRSDYIQTSQITETPDSQPATTPPEMLSNPLSIYSEYIANPYNIKGYNLQQITISSNATQKEVDPTNSTEENINARVSIADVNNPMISTNSNVFNSSNYFFSNMTAIPLGSEILFGTDIPSNK